MSLAAVIDLPEPEQPTKRTCYGCGELRGYSRFLKTQRDDPDARCSSCRAPKPVPDPDTPLTKVMAQSLSFPVSDDWAAKMTSGANFRVEVVLHVDHAMGGDDAPLHWAARWLEVTRLGD